MRSTRSDWRVRSETAALPAQAPWHDSEAGRLRAAEGQEPEEAGEQYQVEGKQFYRHIISHVQHEDLNHVSKADQSAEGGRAGNDQQQSAEHSAQPAKIS